MGLRDLVVLLIVLLAIYLIWLLLRAWRLNRSAKKTKPTAGSASKSRAEPAGLTPARGVNSGDDDDGEDDHDHAVVSLSTSAARQSALIDDAQNYVAQKDVAEGARPAFGFDAMLEVRQLRHIVDTLRSDQAILQDEVAHLREALQKVSSEVRTASRISPQYGEAVGLARKGWDAQAIAERCGISVAEAELVRTLSELPGGGE